MVRLKISGLSVRLGDRRVVDNASMTFQPSEFVVILAPNGAGKTSLLRAALGLLKPCEGEAYLDGINTLEMSPAARSRLVSYLPQARALAWPLRVKDVVALGRYSYGGSLVHLSEDDNRAINKALLESGIAHLSERFANEISGGEMALVHIARAMAAETPLMIADEPIASLDPRHQLGVLDLIKTYVQGGGGALVSMHDIQLAARYATRLIWMRNGQILANGCVEDTLSSSQIAKTYAVQAVVKGRNVHIAKPL